MKYTFTLFTFILVISAFGQTIINSGSTWKYLDNGTDLTGSNWTEITYNDASWGQGNAELGYGDGDENTVVSYGPDGNNKYPTTYFRKTFSVADPSAFGQLNFEIVRDDGAVIYINGVEVYRTNMPGGVINYNTYSDGTIAWPSEDDWHAGSASASLLVTGNNVIAVEVHQSDASSSDISFNFQMSGVSANSMNVSRGPYLQKATQNSIVVRWRTDQPTETKVKYGLVSHALNDSVFNAVLTTEHEIEITGLQTATPYYYSIGSANEELQESYFQFKTLPDEGTEGMYRFWVIGDAGTGDQIQQDVTASFETYNGGPHTDGWIMLGDNAYESGFDNEYQDHVFYGVYDEILGSTVLWPAPGNHDYNNHIPFSPDPAYFDIFSLPTNAESGGVSSGTEKYYSWNHGNIHFISLDSYDVSRSATGAMANWLTSDLQNNNLPWVIAYWHHPPYTKGSHDSDNDNFLDGELVDMRENIVPVLENHGVDLVLCGHSHTYERSNLIDGHYGESDQLQQSMVLDNSSGDYPTDCPYIKEGGISVSHNGAVYSVIGCSGKISGVDSEWPHPVMESYTETEPGSLILDINDNRLDGTFLTDDGTVYDHYTILKDVSKTQTYQVCPGDQIELIPSWNDLATWQPFGLQSNTYQLTATINSTILAESPNLCMVDTFQIEMLPDEQCALSVEEQNESGFNLFPNPNRGGKALFFEWDNEIVKSNDLDITLVNQNGQIIFRESFTQKPSSIILPKGLAAGSYIVRVKAQNKMTQKTIIIQ